MIYLPGGLASLRWPRPRAAIAVSEPVLEAVDVSVRFGGLIAVDAVSATFRAGERVGIIGPNGAGKTTFFNALSGVQVPTSGTIRVGGVDLTGARPHRFARAGVARTFQTPRVFAGLSVADNVAFGSEFAGRARAGGARRDEHARFWSVSASRRRRRGRRRSSRRRSNACSRSAWRWQRDRESCCSTKSRPASPRSSSSAPRASSVASPTTSDSPWSGSSTP